MLCNGYSSAHNSKSKWKQLQKIRTGINLVFSIMLVVLRDMPQTKPSVSANPNESTATAMQKECRHFLSILKSSLV